MELTALRSRREESNLELFLAEFISKLNDSVPGTCPDRVAVDIEIIYKVNLSTNINGNLISGTDGQAWVVSGAIVHECLASSRVGLFIDSAWKRKLLLNASRGKQPCSPVEYGRINIYRWSPCT